MITSKKGQSSFHVMGEIIEAQKSTAKLSPPL